MALCSNSFLWTHHMLMPEKSVIVILHILPDSNKNCIQKTCDSYIYVAESFCICCIFLSKPLECSWIIFEWSLILYSIIMPFDAFEISCIWKYSGKWSICSFKCYLSRIFSEVFKLYSNFSWLFSMLSKNRKWCHDLKIAYWVKD